MNDNTNDSGNDDRRRRTIILALGVIASLVILFVVVFTSGDQAPEPIQHEVPTSSEAGDEVEDEVVDLQPNEVSVDDLQANMHEYDGQNVVLVAEIISVGSDGNVVMVRDVGESEGPEMLVIISPGSDIGGARVEDQVRIEGGVALVYLGEREDVSEEDAWQPMMEAVSISLLNSDSSAE